MSSSIYNVQNWATNTNYEVWDIVFYNNYYYYCIERHSSGLSFDTSVWDGTILFNGITRPFFFFKPGYNAEAPIRPNIKKVQFGDGYAQTSPDGINNVLLTFNLTFDSRTEAEMTAILHFLNQRGGFESFVYSPISPYRQNKLFKCEDFSHQYKFFDNFDVRCVFNESIT